MGLYQSIHREHDANCMITSDMLPSNDMIFDMIDVNSHETVSIKSFDLNVEKPELDDILKTDTESKEILRNLRKNYQNYCMFLIIYNLTS